MCSSCCYVATLVAKVPVGHFDRGVCKCNARWCSLLSTPGGGEHFQGVSKNIIPCLNVDFNMMEMDEKFTFQKAHCRSPVGRCCLSILTFSLDLTPVKRRIPRSGLALEMASNNALYLQWFVSLYHCQRDLEKSDAVQDPGMQLYSQLSVLFYFVELGNMTTRDLANATFQFSFNPVCTTL